MAKIPPWLALFWLCPWLNPAVADPAVIWSGNSAGYDVEWREDDIRVLPDKDGAEGFSMEQVARQDFARFQANLAGEEDCSYERQVSILSLAGPLLSLKDSYYAYCQGWAHPAVETRFTALDLSASGSLVYADPWQGESFEVDSDGPGRVARLDDWFKPEAIYRALVADSLLQLAFPNQFPPADLKELLTQVAGRSVEVRGCPFLIPPDLLTRFALHHLEDDDQVAVRLGLPPAAGACRGRHAQLGILLPIPNELRESLKSAQMRRAGYLMESQQAVADDRSTTLVFPREPGE